MPAIRHQQTGHRPNPDRKGATTPLDAQIYDRQRDLPKLLSLWPHEMADRSPRGLQEIVQRLTRALRVERKLGQSGHWAYDIHRHAGLARALRAEKRGLVSAIRDGRNGPSETGRAVRRHNVTQDHRATGGRLTTSAIVACPSGRH